MILTCTFCLLVFTHLSPVLQSDTTENTPSHFFSGWFEIFGVPDTILSDRYKIWAVHLWKSLMNKLNISFHMTSAFHPQADSWSEQTKNFVGQILWTFTPKQQLKWLEALPSVFFYKGGVCETKLIQLSQNCLRLNKKLLV